MGHLTTNKGHHPSCITGLVTIGGCCLAPIEGWVTLCGCHRISVEVLMIITGGPFLTSTESLETSYLSPVVMTASIHWLTLKEGLVTEVAYCLISTENWVTIRGCCLVSIEGGLIGGSGVLTSTENMDTIPRNCLTPK